MQDLVTRANAKLNERIEEICQWQTDLQRWYKQMEKQAENEATETLIKLNLDDTELVISGSFMEQFREAYQMVNFFLMKNFLNSFYISLADNFFLLC